MVKNPTVLVVNDDPSQLRITSKALSCDGFEVLPCADAEQALRLLGEGGAVDVVVTDLYMPGIDGWRLCRLLRSAAFARFNTIPILVVSAIFSGSDAEDLTVQLGADGFLAAPYEPAKLCRVVRNLIGDLKLVQLCETAVRQRALLRIEDLLQMRTRRLRASEDRYRNLFENAGDGIVTYTLDGITISVNRALETLLVMTRDELVGKSYERLMTAVSLATAKKAQQEARANREDAWTYTLELVRPDGTLVPVQSHCRFLRDTDGGPTMVMATYRDLTVERRLEQQP